MGQNEKNPRKIVTGVHRLSFVHLKEPHAFEGSNNEKYHVTLLIKKDHPDVDRIKEVIKATYAANKESMFKGLPLSSKNIYKPLQDGDELVAEKPEMKAYEGCYYLKADSKTQPKAFYSDKQEILDLDEVYSGCYCRSVIVCATYDTVSKGIKFYLNSVMKIKDGERLGGFEADPDDYDEGSNEFEEDDDLL